MDEKLKYNAIFHQKDLQISDFEWITDKNLLRDEGVYFGLSDSDQVPEEKINAIRQFFQERIKILDTERHAQIRFADESEKMINSLHVGVAQKKEVIKKLKDGFVTQDHNFGRYFIGLSVYFLIVVFNFWLIYFWLESAQVNAPILTTVGVYLFGSMSLFGQFSLMYHGNEQVLNTTGEKREKWKVYTEELLIPFIVSAYLTFKGYAAHGLGEAAIFFILSLALFLYAGKGFLMQLIKTKSELSKMLRNYANKKDIKRQTIKIEGDIKSDILALESQQNALTDLRSQMLETEKAIAMVTEQKETNVLLFLSEYELAKSARQTLNRKQISQIISSRR